MSVVVAVVVREPTEQAKRQGRHQIGESLLLLKKKKWERKKGDAATEEKRKEKKKKSKVGRAQFSLGTKWQTATEKSRVAK